MYFPLFVLKSLDILATPASLSLSVFSEIINIILHVMFCKSDLANSANQDVSGILCEVDYFAFKYHSSSAYGKYLKYFICFKLLL